MELWTHLLTFLGGLGAGWSFKAIISNKTSHEKRTTIVSQKNIDAGGDVVAGDKHNVPK